MPSSSLHVEPARPAAATPAAARRATTVRRPTRHQRWSGFWREGMPAIWAGGAMLVGVVAMLVTILALTLVRGLAQFWARPLVRLETTAGAFLGPVQATEVTLATPSGAPPARVRRGRSIAHGAPAEARQLRPPPWSVA